MSRSPVSIAAGLAALGLLLWALTVYPFNPVLLGGGLAIYAALLWNKPYAWLGVVPALLPVFDLAPFTGWFFIDELDLLLLATAAIGYLRAPRSASARWPAFLLFAMALFTGCYVLGTVTGLEPLPDLDVNALTSYHSHWNAVRVFKGLAWALVLLPLLRRTAGPELVHLRTWFLPGMLAGLGLACLGVMYERLLFPGLLNFSAEYRPTGTFSAMHTGGAALDAYLALAFPLVAVWVFGAGSRLRHALGLVLLLMACYAGFTTFSRDMFLAYGASSVVMVTLLGLHRLRGGDWRWPTVLGMAGLLVVVTLALVRLFPAGGYRGLAAALALLLASVVLASLRGSPRNPGRDIGLAALGALLAAGLSFALAKGPYLAVAVGTAVFTAAAVLSTRAAQRAMAVQACHAAWGALLAGTVLVPRYWGGDAALVPAAAVALLAALLVVANRLPREPLWTLNRATLTTGLLAGIVMATAIPIAGSYYLGSRFATVGNDMETRIEHWHDALNMMDDNVGTTLFGMGLGRYPDTYAWKNTRGEMPGQYQFDIEEFSNQYLRLTMPQYPIGYGEMLNFVQRVEAPAGRTYVLNLDARRSSPDVPLRVALCERWLIYPQNCRAAPVRLRTADGKWHHYEVEITGGTPPSGPSFLRPPVQLQVTAEGSGVRVDVDNISLVEKSTRKELVKNGSFSDSNDYWFISSDHTHMPYHVKNFAVNTVFETGWVGFGVTVLLLLYVGGNLAGRALNGELEAAAILAGITGFMVVGLFDSLFDVPRLTFVFFLLVLAAFAKPVPVKTRKRVRKPGSGRRVDYGQRASSGAAPAEAPVASSPALPSPPATEAAAVTQTQPA